MSTQNADQPGRQRIAIVTDKLRSGFQPDSFGHLTLRTHMHDPIDLSSCCSGVLHILPVQGGALSLS